MALQTKVLYYSRNLKDKIYHAIQLLYKLSTRFSIFLTICEIYGFLNFYIRDDKLKSRYLS